MKLSNRELLIMIASFLIGKELGDVIVYLVEYFR